MRTEVTGKQLDVGDALREYAAAKLHEAVEKYAIRPVEANVTLSRDAHFFTCDCLAHMSTGLTAQASARDTEIYAALDQAVARLEKQLRRHKRRLKDHHQRRKEPIAQVEAASYVLEGAYEEEVEETPQLDSESATALVDGLTQGQEFWRPTIIAEGKEQIPSLSVGEAVMQMELKGAHFVLFFNESGGRINAVYRREDGNIGWVDPALGATTTR